MHFTYIDEILPGFLNGEGTLQAFYGTISGDALLRIESQNNSWDLSLKEVFKLFPTELRFRLLKKILSAQSHKEETCEIFVSLHTRQQNLTVIRLKFALQPDFFSLSEISFDGWVLPSKLAIELFLGWIREFRFALNLTGLNSVLVGSQGSLKEVISWSQKDADCIKGLRNNMLLAEAPANFKPFAEFILNCSDKNICRGEILCDNNTRFSATYIKLYGLPLESDGLALFISSRLRQNDEIVERLKSAEKLYQQLFELSPAGMLLEDIHGYIIDVNQALLDATGYKKNEIINKHVSIFAAPENLPHIEENIRRIVNGEKLDLIVESRRKDGAKFYSRLIETLITLADGQQAILSISSDITDRVLMQRQLEEEKEKYRRFFENVLDIFFVTTPDGAVRHISPSVESYLGYTPAEILSKNSVAFYLNPSYRNLFVNKLKEHREVLDLEIPLVAKSGSIRYFSLNAHGIYSDNGELTEIEGVLRDITEKKQYLAELEEARRKAEESAALKSSLLSNMSHEVRTPLNSILGFSQMLYHNHPDPAVKEVVQKIHASGERLLKTLESIMLVAQLDSGLKPEPDHWALDQALARVFLEYKSVAEEKGLAYILDSEEGLWVHTDEKLLSICVKELIDNAVKFTKEGGITLRLKPIQTDQGLMARIEVRDTGIGIPLSKHELIFKEFRQASEGMSRSFEGLGLGLSIVRRLVQLLGGTLTFESSPGLGTSFYLDLPCLAEEEVASEPIPEAPLIRQITFKPEGLLIEDNAINAEITESFLEGVCTLDIVPNFWDALKLIQFKKYDFFLIDIALGPGPSGIELLKKIREIEHYQSTPTVAVTGFAQHGDAGKLRSLGFTHYISKPFTRDEIVSLIQKIFQNN